MVRSHLYHGCRANVRHTVWLAAATFLMIQASPTAAQSNEPALSLSSQLLVITKLKVLTADQSLGIAVVTGIARVDIPNDPPQTTLEPLLPVLPTKCERDVCEATRGLQLFARIPFQGAGECNFRSVTVTFAFPAKEHDYVTARSATNALRASVPGEATLEVPNTSCATFMGKTPNEIRAEAWIRALPGLVIRNLGSTTGFAIEPVEPNRLTLFTGPDEHVEGYRWF